MLEPPIDLMPRYFQVLCYLMQLWSTGSRCETIVDISLMFGVGMQVVGLARLPLQNVLNRIVINFCLVSARGRTMFATGL